MLLLLTVTGESIGTTPAARHSSPIAVGCSVAGRRMMRELSDEFYLRGGPMGPKRRGSRDHDLLLREAREDIQCTT